MKIGMLTSELWPVFSGGLGVAVYELVRALEKDPSFSFTLAIPELHWSGDLESEVIETPDGAGYSVYFYEGEPILSWESKQGILDFNRALVRCLARKDLDLVHANDWMTLPAGVALRDMKGVPLIFHIHSTEHDRTNGNPREWVVNMEKRGCREADLVVANSHRTRQELVEWYGIDPGKVRVIYNGIDLDKFQGPISRELKKPGEDVALFVGRLTIQKGVWHFLHAARQVVDQKPEAKFVVVGSGPDMGHLIDTAINLGIQKNVLFTGKISDQELIAAYRMCDVFVMPSVNEPFGIVALEALASGKPVIMSKSAGVSEVIEHCFKVDYWDTNLLASRMLEVFHYHELQRAMGQNGSTEVRKLSWDNTAEEFKGTYRRAVHA